MNWEDWASNLKVGDTAYATPGPFVVAEVNEHCVVDTDGNEHSWHDIGPDTPGEPPVTGRDAVEKIAKERDGLLSELREARALRTMRSGPWPYYDKAHDVLSMFGAPRGPLDERIRKLAERWRAEVDGVREALTAAGVAAEGTLAERVGRLIHHHQSLLECEKAEAARVLGVCTKERDFWSAEAARAFKERDDARHDLRHTQSEREQALERALSNLALIWSSGVRP